jgi:hypothetical protein
MLKLRVVLAAACVALAGAFAAEPPPTPTPARFSQALGAGERTSTGLARLNSDQIGALDALVRRDTTTRSHVRADPNAPARFSQRLTADERRVTGLDALPAEDLARLDAAVERLTQGTLARALLSPPVYLSRASRIEPRETKKEREIHGSFSLSYGWGSGGYSEKSGSMMLHMEDPDRGFSVSVGYSHTEYKGPGGRYIVDGPPFRP